MSSKKGVVLSDKEASRIAKRMFDVVDNDDVVERGEFLRMQPMRIINPESVLMPLRPSWPSIRKFKMTMAGILILVGAVVIIAFAVDPNGQSSMLATQIPPPGQSVGRVKSTPVSREVGVITPQLVIGICCMMSGAWIMASVNVMIVYNRLRKEVSLFSAYTLYYQICFQGTAIILTILPLAGVINVYELAFAVALTWAEMLMYLFTDITNALPMHDWELIDNAIYKVAGDPVKTYQNVKNNSKEVPWLKFCAKPLIGAFLTHIFTWTIITIHIVEAIESTSYEIETRFVVIVFGTLLLQLVIPLFKGLQLMRIDALMHWFKFYRVVVLIIECVQFLNMVLIAVFLL